VLKKEDILKLLGKKDISYYDVLALKINEIKRIT